MNDNLRNYTTEELRKSLKARLNTLASECKYDLYTNVVRGFALIDFFKESLGVEIADLEEDFRKATEDEE